MQVSVGTLGNPQKDSDTRGHQYGGLAIRVPGIYKDIRKLLLSYLLVITQVTSLTQVTTGSYNAPHWGGGYFEPPPFDLRNYWTDSKNSSGI